MVAMAIANQLWAMSSVSGSYIEQFLKLLHELLYNYGIFTTTDFLLFQIQLDE